MFLLFLDFRMMAGGRQKLRERMVGLGWYQAIIFRIVEWYDILEGSQEICAYDGVLFMSESTMELSEKDLSLDARAMIPA